MTPTEIEIAALQRAHLNLSKLQEKHRKQVHDLSERVLVLETFIVESVVKKGQPQKWNQQSSKK